MPLSLSNRDQNSGHLFYNRRLRAATTRFSVRMKHDDRKQTAALALSMVLVAIAAGWMMLLNVLKPTGIVGDSAIIGDRDSGALYARIDGRLYPALNLTSARLATGTAGQPTWVKPAEIAKYPTGPLVGIPGAPAAMPVNRGAVSAWAVCDTAGRPRSADKPVVTSIAGPITGGGRATHLRDDAGLLVTFDGSTYVIWGGKRSQIDPTNRAVTLSLGLDPGVTSPIQISRARHRPPTAAHPRRHSRSAAAPATAPPAQRHPTSPRPTSSCARSCAPHRRGCTIRCAPPTSPAPARPPNRHRSARTPPQPDHHRPSPHTRPAPRSATRSPHPNPHPQPPPRRPRYQGPRDRPPTAPSAHDHIPKFVAIAPV